ncbi:MAG: sugar transferase [Ruminococcaceae bacterium]|nr:sugar transferase [Oscillospiraceae bacterium]
MRNKHIPYGPYERLFKRAFDIVCALAAIIVFSWLYIIIAILVKVNLGSPIIFKQERPGKDGKVFNLYKFRSMTDERDENGKLLPNEIRLTKFGKILRSTSLDELPEAFNILRGDMSIVGPRPLLVGYLPYYTEEELARHDVRPGLTGLAQVNGRNAIDWDEKLAYDIEYVSRITFAGDIKIIISTVIKAIKRSGIQFSDSKDRRGFIDQRKDRMKLDSAKTGSEKHRVN